MNPTLVIRTDAGPKIGHGHYMRCRALADAWSGKVFFTGEVPNANRTLFTANDLNAFAEEVKADWIVLDGYQFDSAYQRQIRHKLLIIDDYGHAGAYRGEFILNQNLGIDANWYPAEAKTLLGSRYVLLRREFLHWRNEARIIAEKVEKVLVTLGGSDPDNVTLEIMEALKIPATIVVGPANPHQEILKEKAGIHSIVVNPPNLPQLMAEADFAFCAGGTTAWELSFVGTPFMVTAIAENQRRNAEQLIKLGIAEKLDANKIPSQTRRDEMSRKGFALIDGQGPERVVQQLLNEKIRLRPAQWGDSRLLWEWANEPDARAQSFSSDPIPWENHEKWFAVKMRQANCRLYIAVDAEERPVGQIRFDDATLSVSLDKNFRGQGLGVQVITHGTRRIFKDTTIDHIDAWVKRENSASTRAFAQAGFENKGLETMNGHSALHFVLKRKS